MWRLWRRNSDIRQVSTRPPDLQGSPLRPRPKTYSADSGFAYQYVYLGWRRTPEEDASDYLFDTARDRFSRFHAVVRLADTDLAKCEDCIGRQLSATERYAVAKLTLFSAFDSITDVVQFEAPISPKSEQILEHLRILDRI